MTHPTDESYDAGVHLAKVCPDLEEADVTNKAEHYDDPEAFCDGYWDTIHSSGEE